MPAETPRHQSTSQLPAAVLWDFDGTLVNTEPCWMAEEQDIVRRHGGEWTLADSHAVMGQDTKVVVKMLAERCPDGHLLDTDQLLDEWITAVIERVRHTPDADLWMPGARRLLDQLQQQRVPVALVTSSPQRCVAPVAERMGEHPFDVMVTADDVERLKPDPLPYLTAARALGVDPTQCIVLEDSGTGTRAGRAAGCFVVRVHPGDDASGAHALLPSLADTELPDLLALWRQR